MCSMSHEKKKKKQVASHTSYSTVSQSNSLSASQPNPLCECTMGFLQAKLHPLHSFKKQSERRVFLFEFRHKLWHSVCTHSAHVLR